MHIFNNSSKFNTSAQKDYVIVLLSREKLNLNNSWPFGTTTVSHVLSLLKLGSDVVQFTRRESEQLGFFHRGSDVHPSSDVRHPHQSLEGLVQTKV